MSKWIVTVAEQGLSAIAGPVVIAAAVYDSAIPAPVYKYTNDEGMPVITGVEGYKHMPPTIQRYMIADLRRITSHTCTVKFSGHLLKDLKAAKKVALGVGVARLMERLQLAGQLSEPDDYTLQLPDQNPLPPRFLGGMRQLGRVTGTDWHCEATKAIADAQREFYLGFLHDQHPEYEFMEHGGYPVPKHIRLIGKYGTTRAHHYIGTPE